MDLIFVSCKAVQRSSFHFPRSHDDDPLTHFWDYFNIFSYTVHVRQIEMMPDGLQLTCVRAGRESEIVINLELV